MKELTIHQVCHDDRDNKFARQADLIARPRDGASDGFAQGGGQMKKKVEKGSAPGFSPELGERIAWAIKDAGGMMAASRKLGRTKDTLSNWRDGVTKIFLHDIMELAAAAECDPVWLAFGYESSAGAPATVPLDAIRDTWDFWMPVILRLKDRPDPSTLREQFLADVIERSKRHL